MLVLDVAKLQERVRVARRLDQRVGVLVVEILGGAVGALDQLGAREQSMPQQAVNYFSRMMQARVEEDDRSVRSLPVQPRCVDAGPYVLRRLTEVPKRSDLRVDLLLEGDHHPASVVDPEVGRLLNRMLLQCPVQR